MANEIKIVIGGDPSGFIRASQQSGAALDQLGNAAESAAQSFAQLGPATQRAGQNVERFKAGLRADPTGQASILNVSGDFKKIENSSRGAAAGVRSFGNAAAAGNAAVLDFSRVIQDMPFGLVGIVNNLTQIPGTLQRLSVAAKESGKSMGALLFSSVSGFAGIGLILSAVTSGLLIFQNGIQGFGRASKKAKEDADELAKTIRSIGEIQAEATGGVQGQISQVNALAAAVSDSNLPYEQRKRALEELRQINKSYFGDLKLEDEATGKLAKTVEEYTKALVSAAIVKSFVNEIADVAKAASKANVDLTVATDRLTRAEKALKAARSTGPVRGREGTAETSAAVDANNELLTAFEEQRAAREKLLTLETQQITLQGQLNKAQLEALKFKDVDAKGSEREIDLLAKRLVALEKIKDATKDLSAVADLQQQIFDLQVKITLRDAAKNGLSQQEIDLAIKGFRDQLSEAFENETLSLESIIKVKPTRVELAEFSQAEIDALVNGTKVKSTAPLSGLAKNLKEIKIDGRALRVKLLGLPIVEAEEFAKNAVEQLRDTIASSLTSAIGESANLFGELFAGIISGDGIGSALARAAQGFLSIIGTVLQDIGKQIIATSIAVQALKKALASLFTNPILAIGAGLGLIALGGVLKNMKFNLPKFQDGGITSGPSSGFPAILHPNEAIIPLNKLPDIVGRLKANDLNLTLLPSIRFSGSDFQIMLERVQNRRERLG